MTLMLALVMVITMVPSMAFAAEDKDTEKEPVAEVRLSSNDNVYKFDGWIEVGSFLAYLKESPDTVTIKALRDNDEVENPDILSLVRADIKNYVVDLNGHTAACMLSISDLSDSTVTVKGGGLITMRGSNNNMAIPASRLKKLVIEDGVHIGGSISFNEVESLEIDNAIFEYGEKRSMDIGEDGSCNVVIKNGIFTMPFVENPERDEYGRVVNCNDAKWLAEGAVVEKGYFSDENQWVADEEKGFLYKVTTPVKDDTDEPGTDNGKDPSDNPDNGDADKDNQGNIEKPESADKDDSANVNKPADKDNVSDNYQQSNKETEEAPKTGDEANLMMWLALLAAAAGTTVLAKRRAEK